jgi:hypothetical protein
MDQGRGRRWAENGGGTCGPHLATNEGADLLPLHCFRGGIGFDRPDLNQVF